jgi:hypothetical protein
VSDDRTILPPTGIESDNIVTLPTKRPVSPLHIVKDEERKQHGLCAHNGKVHADLKTRRLWCAACKATLDPIEYLLRLDQYFRQAARTLETAKYYHQLQVEREQRADARRQRRGGCHVKGCTAIFLRGCQHKYPPESRRIRCRNGVCPEHGHHAPSRLCITHAPKKARTA